MPKLLLALPAIALACAPVPAHASPVVCVTAYSTVTTTVHACDPTNGFGGGLLYQCPTVYSPAYGAGVVVCYGLRSGPPPTP